MREKEVLTGPQVAHSRPGGVCASAQLVDDLESAERIHFSRLSDIDNSNYNSTGTYLLSVKSHPGSLLLHFDVAHLASRYNKFSS